MRKLTVTKEEFNYFLWPIIASNPAGDDIETALRVIKKFKGLQTAHLVLPSDAQVEEAKKSGGRPIPDWNIAIKEVVLFLEEDERVYILSKTKPAEKNVIAAILNDLRDLNKKIDEAVEYNVTISLKES